MKHARWIVLAVLALLVAVIGGYFAGRHARPATNRTLASVAGDHAARRILYWKAPMTPGFRSDKPGKSPMGMDLVPVYADDGEPGGSADVRISPEVVNNLGVRTAVVRRGAFSQRLELVGYVDYDQDTVTSIHTRAEGWVETLAVKSVGDPVARGQLLYRLFSPRLAIAQREYLTALASGSRSLVAASRERLRSLGFTRAQIVQLDRTRKVGDQVSRYAGHAGVVTSLGVREGAYVIPATQVMQLADTRTVWVLAEVDQSQAASLHAGQQAMAVFDAFPGQNWKGTVDYVYPDLSSTTRTVKVRLRFANADLRLRPNMYAHVTLQVTPQHGVLLVPELALIRTGRSQRVIVALGDGRFDVCPVQAGATADGNTEILAGLREGQRVVTSAQFMIDSEANVDAAALRIGAGRPGCVGPPEPGSAHQPGPDAAGMAGMDPSHGASTAPPAGTRR